jgi:broad specificity phosphatase PhoE
VAARVFYLARHGETDWNAAARWQGQTDVPLNHVGRGQAVALAERLVGLGLVGIVSSDLGRARETAEIVAAKLAMGIDLYEPALRERSLGVFDGLTREECATLHAEAWKAWMDERRPPAGAEGDGALAERVLAALDRVANRIAKAPLLIVSHGGAIRAAIAAATGVLPAPVPNCGVLRVEWDGRLLRAEAF